jgi:protein-disulfide isomerase
MTPDKHDILEEMRQLIFSAALALLTACSSTAAQPARPLSPADVVATVGSTKITLAQVDEQALEQTTDNFRSVKLSQALYDARRAVVEELIANALLDQEAKARGVERSALIEKEITSKLSPVTDTEINSWYEANKARVPQGASLEQVRQPIRAYLTQERMQTIRQQLLDVLKSKTPVRIMLEPPRQAVATPPTSPAKGPSTAPIELIEFSDFQCPFCLRANPTVEQVLNTYGDKIHFVYRHFPLPNHPSARPAAEASQCAAEQGKFWPFHDKLFANPSRLGDADFKQHASELGLDTGKFNACVDSHKYKGVVDADVKAGEQAGITGTPAFFVNGRFLSGAQPFNAFQDAIEDALAAQ